MKIYIASSLENMENVRLLGKHLRAAGHSITYDWTTHGPVYKEDQTAAVNHAAMCAVGQLELAGVAAADLVIVLHRGGRGTHVELGAALALDIPVLILGLEAAHYEGWPCAFYAHPGVKVHPDKSPDGFEHIATHLTDYAPHLWKPHLQKR